METYSDIWKTIKNSEPVPTFGFQYAVGLESLSINVDRMIDGFRLGVKELMGIWKGFLSREIIDFLLAIAGSPKEKFHIPDEVWVEIIYSFAIASHENLINKEHLLKSLTPLYIGRTVSFVVNTWDNNASEVEEKIEQLCKVFEDKKTFLLENWK